MTRQQAINAKCKDCSYDSCDSGTWRQQVEACTATDCALWPYRPKAARSPTEAGNGPQIACTSEPRTLEAMPGGEP